MSFRTRDSSGSGKPGRLEVNSELVRLLQTSLNCYTLYLGLPRRDMLLSNAGWPGFQQHQCPGNSGGNQAMAWPSSPQWAARENLGVELPDWKLPWRSGCREGTKLAAGLGLSYKARLDYDRESIPPSDSWCKTEKPTPQSRVWGLWHPHSSWIRAGRRHGAEKGPSGKPARICLPSFCSTATSWLLPH